MTSDSNNTYYDIIDILTKKYGYDRNLIDANAKFENNNNISLDIIGYTSDDKKNIEFFIECKNYVGNTINEHIKKIALELKPNFFIIWKDQEMNKTYKIINDEVIEIGHIPKFNESVYEDIRIDDVVAKFQRIIKRFKTFGASELDYVIDLAKIIACKIYDEEKETKIFLNLSNDSKNNLCQLEAIWKKISNQYSEFDSYKMFLCSDKIISSVCSEIKNFSFLKTGKYEIYMGYAKAIEPSYRIDSPLIIEAISHLLQIKNNKKIIVPFCDYGHIFLVINQLFNNMKFTNEKNTIYYGIVNNKIQKAITKFILKQYNMNNTIIVGEPISDISYNKIKNYDYAIIPLPIHIKIRTELQKCSDIDLGDYMESYLIYRMIQNLNNGGKIGLLAPYDFLTSKKYNKIRKWLMEKHTIRAIISIPIHNIKISTVSSHIIIIEKNKNASWDKIFVSRNQNKFNGQHLVEIHKLENILKNSILNFGLACQIKEIKNESDNAFFINAGDLKNEWSIQHLTPSHRDIINQISNKIQLHKIAKIIQGKPISTIYRVTNGIPYIRISDIQNGALNIENSVRIDSKNAKMNIVKIETDDILISIRGTIGKVSIVPTDLHGCYLSPQLAIIRINKNNINPKFIKYQIQYSKLIKKQITNHQKGSFIQNISIRDIENLYISILSLDDQKKYLQEIDKLLRIEQSLQENSMKIRSNLDELL